MSGSASPPRVPPTGRSRSRDTPRRPTPPSSPTVPWPGALAVPPGPGPPPLPAAAEILVEICGLLRTVGLMSSCIFQWMHIPYMIFHTEYIPCIFHAYSTHCLVVPALSPGQSSCSWISPRIQTAHTQITTSSRPIQPSAGFTNCCRATSFDSMVCGCFEVRPGPSVLQKHPPVTG